MSAARRQTVAGAGPGRRLVLAAMTLAVALPLVPLLVWAFAFRWTFPDLVPAVWSARQWRYLASPAAQLWPALANSVTLALAVTTLAVLLAVPAGRALGMHAFRGKRAVELLLFAPIIVPGLASTMGIHIVFIRYQLADTWLGVVLVQLVTALPYATLALASVFSTYDAAYEQQARVLGASPLRAFVLVTLPAIAPGVVVGGVLAFLSSWSQYLLTLLIGGGSVTTLPMLLVAFARSGDNGVTAALSLVYVAPALLLLLVAVRRLGAGPPSFAGRRAP